MKSLSVALLALLASADVVSGKRSSKQKLTGRDKQLVGPRDRFWRHHVVSETLEVKGVNQYHNIKNCINDKLTDQDQHDLQHVTAAGKRRAAHRVQTPDDDTILVLVENAMAPIHVKAVQSLASCVRTHIPHLYESRAMYQEFDLDKDPGLGGNCPTHLAPLVGMFLPTVANEMFMTLEVAYQVGDWQAWVDEEIEELERGDRIFSETMQPPSKVGMRASEHLTYSDFPSLAEHHDGAATMYTMNFAFSAPDDYEGGEYFIYTDKDNDEKKIIKPPKYGAMVFLGGRYLHGVQEITGGHREMFSTEMWNYPDTPFGSTLWTNIPQNMESYIKECNQEVEQTPGKTIHDECTADFKMTTGRGVDMAEVHTKYNHEGKYHRDQQEQGKKKKEEEVETQSPFTRKSEQEEKDDFARPNRVRPNPLKPIGFLDEKSGKEYKLSDFREDEHDFLIPKSLEPGEMVPLRWRDTFEPVDDDSGESFVVGFPPELHQEFVSYIEKNGMMDVARQILYEEEPLEPGDHKLYKLEDGQNWGAMIQGSWDTDMVWLDPADEECFESLLGVLRRGNFDTVLDAVGRAFDLNGLMVQGVGAIFLSEYEVPDNLHIDIPGSRGSFYNIIVPVHIPAEKNATFCVANSERDLVGEVKLDPSYGVVLGGESVHGTGKCHYRDTKDFRLSFAVYVADINDDNIDLIASDSTSLWPSKGDTFWFAAQEGRLWSKEDPNKTLKTDGGRKPLTVVDQNKLCSKMPPKMCMEDPQGLRLQCPKTCQLYLENDLYYSKLETFLPSSASDTKNVEQPTCESPTCAA